MYLEKPRSEKKARSDHRPKKCVACPEGEGRREERGVPGEGSRGQLLDGVMDHAEEWKP